MVEAYDLTQFDKTDKFGATPLMDSGPEKKSADFLLHHKAFRPLLHQAASEQSLHRQTEWQAQAEKHGEGISPQKNLPIALELIKKGADINTIANDGKRP